jgi:hypothetical protein
VDAEPEDIDIKLMMLHEFFPNLSTAVLKVALKKTNYDAEMAANRLFDPSSVQQFETEAERKEVASP